MRGSCRSNVLKANLLCKTRWAHDRAQQSSIWYCTSSCAMPPPWTVPRAAPNEATRNLILTFELVQNPNTMERKRTNCFSQWFWKCSGSKAAERGVQTKRKHFIYVKFFGITSTNTALYDIFRTLQPKKTDSWRFFWPFLKPCGRLPSVLIWPKLHLNGGFSSPKLAFLWAHVPQCAGTGNACNHAVPLAGVCWKEASGPK